MTKRLRAAGTAFPAALLLFAATFAAAAPAGLPAGQAAAIRRAAHAALRDWNVPGIAVAVVKDGRAAFAEGFGMREFGQGLPVTPRTRFILGSTTKAFTTLALGLLVADGRLDWDRPVADVLPGFRLKDEYASLHATPRDLASHRTGLPRHDLVWDRSPLGPAEMTAALRWLEPSRELRTAFQYNNLMYIALGHLVEAVSGRTYQDFVRERIFAPLGMTSSGCTIPELVAAAEPARSYRWSGSSFSPQPYPGPVDKLLYGARASGSVNTTAEDLGPWMIAHLRNGNVGGKQVFPAPTVTELHTPQIAMPWDPALGPADVLAPSYALGWMVDVYRGLPRVHHGGSTLDFNSYVSLFPRQGIGVAVLTNASSPAADVLARTIADLLLGLDPVDWTGRTRKRLADSAAPTAARPEPAAARVEAAAGPAKAGPGHALSEYAGSFVHPAYGTLVVDQVSETLQASLHRYASRLRHARFETFVAADGDLEGVELTFRTDAKGAVDAVLANLEPAVAPIVFTRSVR